MGEKWKVVVKVGVQFNGLVVVRVSGKFMLKTVAKSGTVNVGDGQSL